MLINGTQDDMREYAFKVLPKKGRVLEVGCNTGENFAKYFLNKPKRYKGVDNQREKIRIAKKLFPSLKFFSIDCFSDKSRKLIDRTDIFVSFQTLEHIGSSKGDEDLKLLSWVNPGCKILISVPNFDSAYHVRFYDEQIWTKRFKTVMTIEELRTYKRKPDACSYLYIGYRK